MPDHESRSCKLAAFPYGKDDTRLLFAGAVSCPTQRRSIVGPELAVQGVGLFHLLKIQRNSHTVNDDQTLRDQVLIRDVVGRKTVQGRERADEFHGFGGGNCWRKQQALGAEGRVVVARKFQESSLLKLTLTYEDMGQIIGSTWETVTRLIANFRLKQFVKIKGSTPTVRRAELENFLRIQ